MGRVLGVDELFDLGTLPLVLLGFSVVSLIWRRPSLETQATIVPDRPSVGAAIRVEVVCESSGRRSPLLLHLEADPEIGGKRSMALAPIAEGKQRWLTFELTATSRGVYELGPLTVNAADPFGLVSSERARLPARQLYVYPHTEPLDVSRAAADIFGSGSSSATSSRRGAELYAIRDYQPGDDLRKIHWRSTARVGRMMIRQEEQQRDPRLVVLIDDRALTTPAEPSRFETVVSSAASVVKAFMGAGFEVSLATIGQGVVAGYDKGPEHLHRLMERLCVLKPTEDRPRPARLEGSAVMLTLRLDDEALSSMPDPRTGGARMLIVHPGHDDADPVRGVFKARQLGSVVITRHPGTSLGEVWPQIRQSAAR